MPLEDFELAPARFRFDDICERQADAQSLPDRGFHRV